MTTHNWFIYLKYHSILDHVDRLIRVQSFNCILFIRQFVRCPDFSIYFDLRPKEGSFVSLIRKSFVGSRFSICCWRNWLSHLGVQYTFFLYKMNKCLKFINTYWLNKTYIMRKKLNYTKQRTPLKFELLTYKTFIQYKSHYCTLKPIKYFFYKYYVCILCM